jgi:hypothetical protein
MFSPYNPLRPSTGEQIAQHFAFATGRAPSRRMRYDSGCKPGEIVSHPMRLFITQPALIFMAIIFLFLICVVLGWIDNMSCG